MHDTLLFNLVLLFSFIFFTPCLSFSHIQHYDCCRVATQLAVAPSLAISDCDSNYLLIEGGTSVLRARKWQSGMNGVGWWEGSTVGDFTQTSVTTVLPIRLLNLAGGRPNMVSFSPRIIFGWRKSPVSKYFIFMSFAVLGRFVQALHWLVLQQAQVWVPTSGPLSSSELSPLLCLIANLKVVFHLENTCRWEKSSWSRIFFSFFFCLNLLLKITTVFISRPTSLFKWPYHCLVMTYDCDKNYTPAYSTSDGQVVRFVI